MNYRWADAGLNYLQVGFLLLMASLAFPMSEARAERPHEKRQDADCVLTGKVEAVYARETEGYRQYIVEIDVENVEKGPNLKKGNTFRAFCFKRKEGAGGLNFDTAGHYGLPQEGQRIRAFVFCGGGANEGVFPSWFDVVPDAGKPKK